MAIEGPNSSFPIGAGSKKLHVTCNSTTEAEICAGSHGLRQVGLPGSILWDVITGATDAEGTPMDEIVDETLGPVGAGFAGNAHGHTGRKLTPNECILKRKEVPKASPNAINPLDKSLYWHGDNTAEVILSHEATSPAMRYVSKTNATNISFNKE